MDSNARNCQNNLKKMSPYAINESKRKIHALGERNFFSVAWRGDDLSIGIFFFGIYQKMSVIKNGNFRARIQNAIIIAGKKGMVLNAEFRVQNSELLCNFQFSAFNFKLIYCSQDRNNPTILLKRIKSIKTFIIVRKENDRE